MSDVVTVLAGGFSARQVDLGKLPGIIIAVNDSAYYAPRWDICVSMDRVWAENRAAWFAASGKPVWLRRSTIKNFVPTSNVMQFDNDHLATRLSDEPGRLDGTNSGFCALNLAYQLRPKELFLVGFDMALGPRGERHWHPDYPWKNGGGSSAGKLSEWAMQFNRVGMQMIEADITCFQVSPASRRPIPVFHQMRPEIFAKEFECST